MPTLAKLLGKNDIQLSSFASRLESLSGYPNEDNRLLAEVLAKSALKINSLRLDPADTTAKELYQALLLVYAKHSSEFGRAIGEKDSDSPALKLKRLSQLVAVVAGSRVWALKTAVAKDLLRKHPPKRLMKHLGYRSVNSMLKREDIGELFLGMELLESTRFLKSIRGAKRSLTSSDFALCTARVVVLPQSRWAEPAKKSPLLSYSAETGTAGLWPNRLVNTTTYLGLLLLVHQAIDQLTVRSLALKFHQLDSGFKKHLADFWGNEAAPAAQLAGQPIAWRTLFYHYGKGHMGEYGDRLDSYGVDFYDLQTHRRTKRLYDLHVSLGWWTDNEYLLFGDASGKTVSFNLTDVAVNHGAGALFARRTQHAAKANLWDELVSRYCRHPAVENYFLRKLAGNFEFENEPASHALFGRSEPAVWPSEVVAR